MKKETSQIGAGHVLHPGLGLVQLGRGELLASHIAPQTTLEQPVNRHQNGVAGQRRAGAHQYVIGLFLGTQSGCGVCGRGGGTQALGQTQPGRIGSIGVFLARGRMENPLLFSLLEQPVDGVPRDAVSQGDADREQLSNPA